MRTILIISAGGLLALAFAGCGAAYDESRTDGAGRVSVVATTMPVADFARQVGGARVEVTGLLDAEAEPHKYEPTPSDADAVARADLVISNGAGLDGWLDGLLEQVGAYAPRVEAAEGIALLPTEEKGFPGDPHVWHDPKAAARMVDNVAAGLTRVDSAGRAVYRRRAAALRRRIERMAATISASFAAIPPERRDLVTSHDAFGYFARAYDVNVIGSVLPAVTTEAEPSAQQIDALLNEIRAEGVRTIFTEEGVEPRLERRVAEEADARVSTSLYADALGAPGSGATGFVEAQLANARAMRDAWRRR